MSLRMKYITAFAACLCFCLHSTTVVAQTRLPEGQLLNRVNLKQIWWNQATIQKTQETIRYITADEDLVYVQTSGGLVTAFDIKSGKTKWSQQIGRRDYPSVPISSNKKMAVVSVSSMLYALEKSSGELLWKVKTPQSASDAPALDDKQLYLGTVDGTVIAFDIDKIRELHEKGKLPAWSFQAIVWRFKTGRSVSRSPLSNGTTVSFGCKNGSLYTSRVSDGKLVFQFETDDPISAPLSDKENRIFLVSEDAKIYCIDRVQGHTLWTYSAGLPIRNKALVFSEDLFVLPTRGGLRCLSTTLGKSKWWQPKLTGFMAASANNIYASDELGNLVVVSRKDGVELGSIPLREFSHRVVNERTENIFMATPSGLVIALKETESANSPTHNKLESPPALPKGAKPRKAKKHK